MSGAPLKDRLVSGFAELDGNLDEVRLDRFENVMVYSAPASSDASSQYTHGWPRRLTERAHGGFLAGNITCMSKITNVRIRSMARGDVAAFVGTDEMRGSGLSLSELLYCRKVAIECNRESYRFPARLIDSSVRYGLNFATMARLEPDDMQRLDFYQAVPILSQHFLMSPPKSLNSVAVSNSIVVELTGYETRQTSKGVYKTVLFYVERTVTVHIVFCFTCEPKCFYWLAVHMHYKTFCVLCTVKANEQRIQRTKTYNKELAEFHNQFPPTTMVIVT